MWGVMETSYGQQAYDGGRYWCSRTRCLARHLNQCTMVCIVGLNGGKDRPDALSNNGSSMHTAEVYT
jgi:hypothetical protein